MQRKQQFEQVFRSFKGDNDLHIPQMLQQDHSAEQHKEMCLNNAKTFEWFATCMERYEGKIDNVAKYLSLKMLFIEKKGLECYKVHTSDHEFERCQQKVERQLHDFYDQYYQSLLHI